MVVDISKEHEDFIDKLVKSGRFASPSEVVAAALVSLDIQESMAALPEGALEAMYPGLNELVAEGLEDLEAGRFSDGEEFFDELERELSQDPPQDRKTA
jgi:putative addiction module CopG family antidote